MTVAFEIKYPWRKYPKGHKHWPDGYRETFITIWHVDPETDGSDDSCGWSSPRLTAHDKAFAKELADWEEKHPYYFAQPVVHEEKTYIEDNWGTTDPVGVSVYQTYRISPGDCNAIVADIFRRCRWQLEPKNRRKWGLTPRLLAEAMSLGTSEGDNFQSAFAFWDDGRTEARRREKIERTFMLVVRCYRRLTRPWYRHPRWHFRHWQIQVHPLQAFKRWAFSRCCRCGKRFPWGASVGSDSWHSDGPRWLRSEPNVYHMDCGRIRTGHLAAALPTPAGASPASTPEERDRHA